MSTRRRESTATLFWLLLLAAIVATIWWVWRSQPPAAQAWPSGAQEISVRFLKDGDSMEVIALAPGTWLPTGDPVQVRLLGIDAPESHGADGIPQCWAGAAKAELLGLAPQGARLWVTGDTQIQDQYGRYLLYAWTPDGVFVNERLAENGAVRELSIPPNHAYEKLLHDAVQRARATRQGLWEMCIS